MKAKTKKIFVGILLTLALPLQALAQVDPAFNPNKIVDDAVFPDIQTFGGPQGIQKFLEIKNSVLADTSLAFLTKLKEPDSVTLKQNLDDPRPNLGRLRTAAELIWDASRQSGLNPQVILVTLNKEQGLITSANGYSGGKLQKALDRAMGFDCPDGTGCGDLFPGFYYQLFGNYDSDGNRYLGAAKSLIKSFNVPGGRGPQVGGVAAKVGDSVTVDNTQGEPYNAPAQQLVTLANRATAALYRYTPHVFNGNYNFWRYYNGWFKYPNGTLFGVNGGMDVYIIQDGTKQLVPSFVAQARSLDLSKKIILSPTESDSYPTDKVFAPADNTIIKTAEDGKTYIFLSGIKHPVSVFVLSQRGLASAAVLPVALKDAALYDTGSVLPPKDGTIIKGKTAAAVYLVDGGKVKLFSAFTFAQRKISLKQIVPVPDDEIATYENAGLVPPKDGSLVKAKNSTTVFLVENGLKRPLTPELFKNRGLTFRQASEISADEINALPIGAYATPKDRTWFSTAAKGGQLYLFKDGTKHAISSFVAKQRGITPDYIFGADVAYEWFDGIPLPPKDGSLIKGDGEGTIYLVSGSQLHALTALVFQSRKYSYKKVVTLPQTEVDGYAKGEVISK